MSLLLPPVSCERLSSGSADRHSDAGDEPQAISEDARNLNSFDCI